MMTRTSCPASRLFQRTALAAALALSFVTSAQALTLSRPVIQSKQGEALMVETKNSSGKKLFLESYGCQMNFSDSEIVASILSEEGYSTTQNFLDADVIFVNTCAIRENAENRVRQRLQDYKKIKRKNNFLIFIYYT